VAKAKSNSIVKEPSAVAAKRKATASENGGSRAPAKPAKKPAASRTPPPFSTDEIGRVAGDVWGLLVQEGSQTLAAIKKSVDAPADVVAAAIGWLAREDKLEFTTSGRAVKISLR
jgi:Winged helix-turn-helix domain (DUF2582)